MGLNITTYSREKRELSSYERLGSYHSLHILRKWILINIDGNPKDLVDLAYTYGTNEAREAWKKMKPTKCPRIVDHSDCDGGYKSYSFYKLKRPSWKWANLDELFEELKFLRKEYYKKMDDDTKWVFNRFVSILYKKDEYNQLPVKVDFV